MAEPVFHLEMGPLKETQYTGIAQVTAAIAEQMLGDEKRRTAFFYGRIAVEPDIVEDLVIRRNGELLEWYLQRSGMRPAPAAFAGPHSAIFPNRKSCRRGFDIEMPDRPRPQHLPDAAIPQRGHDQLSYQFALRRRAQQRSDLLRLGGDARGCAALSRAARPREGRRRPARRDDGGRGHPAIGRPRRRALCAGARHDRAAQEYRHRPRLPRLQPVDPAPDQIRLSRPLRLGRKIRRAARPLRAAARIRRGRIVFPGFFSEGAKNLLLRHARLLVYPSLFEGFGLPVLEALSLGVPAVMTRSSSLPEVGGDACAYFDPFLAGDFDRALSKALFEMTFEEAAVRQRCLARAAEFSWPRSYARMMAAIEGVLAARGEA